MLDNDRVVTLDDLVERVPEALLREAEQSRLAAEEILDDSYPNRTKGPYNVGKDLSKAERIRNYLTDRPEARNRDVVEALKQYKVTAADVANVKSLMKRSQAKLQGRKTTDARTPPPRTESTALVPAGPGMSITELEAGVAFVKAVGSLTRAKHLLIILETIKDSVK
ncbi:MAG: hypothetical protein ACK6DC_17425 [Planctomycetota bacterium]|jgi:hypothetical protein